MNDKSLNLDDKPSHAVVVLVLHKNTCNVKKHLYDDSLTQPNQSEEQPMMCHSIPNYKKGARDLFQV